MACCAAAPSSRPRSRPPVLLILFGLVTLPALVLDQLSKLYVSSHLALYRSITIVPNWFDITYTLNPGAAFSLFANLPGWFRSTFLVALSAFAIVVLLVLLARTHEVGASSVGMALILAGAIGNLIDRAARGQVIDFIHVHYYTHSYPIFNLADSAITIGVVLIIAHSLPGRAQ